MTELLIGVRELEAWSRAVYKRIGVLDHEQCVTDAQGWPKNTRSRSDIVDQAITELVPEPWRDIVALICEGASYYSRCEDWFKNLT